MEQKSVQLINCNPDDLVNEIVQRLKNELPFENAIASPEKMLTTKQAAEYLNISASTVRRKTKDGTLQFHQIGGQKRYLISELNSSFNK